MVKIKSSRYKMFYKDMLKDDNLITNKKILIIGAGNAGRPAAHLLNYLGNEVTISEIKNYHELPEKAKKKIRILKEKGIEMEFGSHSKDKILWADGIFISPNVPEDAKIYQYIEDRKKNGFLKITTKDIGKILNSLISVPMVGVAGTDGKTTTTNMIYHCLKDTHNPFLFSSLQDSLVIEGLVDLVVENKTQSKDFAVFELPHGTIRMTYGLEICVGVLTNLTPDHMNEFKSFDDYIERNICIIKHLHKNGILIANGDDPIISKKLSNLDESTLFYGFYEPRTIVYKNKIYNHSQDVMLDVVAEDIKLKGLYGSRFKAKIGEIPTAVCENCGKICCDCGNFKRKYIEPGNIKIRLGVPGMCNIENAIATLTATLVLGLDLEHIKNRIESFSGIKGRFEKIETVGGVNVFMDAAHNPEGMERLLDELNMRKRLIITIDNPDTLTVRDKFKIGKVLSKYADVVIASAKNETTGKIDINAAKEVIEGASGIETQWTMSVADAIHKALEIADKGDTIIHMGPGVVNAYSNVKSEIKKGIQAYNKSKDKAVVIGGCGTVGSLMARAFKANGMDVTVSDISNNSQIAEILKKESINLNLGSHDEEILKSAKKVAIAPSLLENKKLIERIKKITNKDIISIDEVLDFCKVNKPVVGITGTNGKTTTTWMLKSILKEAGYKTPEHGLDIQGNTEFIPPLQARLDGDIAVLEIGTFGKTGEIKKCATASKVKIGVITNISKDHLNNAGEFSNYIKCKGEMADVADFLVLNADDPVVAGFALDRDPEKTLFYGIENVNSDINAYQESRSCPVCGSKLKYSRHYLGHLGKYSCYCGFARPKPHIRAYNVDGDHFIMKYGSNTAKIRLKKGGIHNIYNALAAAGGALALKIDLEDISESLENFEGVKGRYDEIDMGKRIIIDYAHNPAGVKAIIQTIMKKKSPNSRLIVVNTISSESGIKGDIEIAKILKDVGVIIATSNASRKAVSKLKMNAHFTKSSKESSKKGTLGASRKQVEEGLKRALDIAKDNDIILVLGEGGVRYTAQILEESSH